MANTGSSSRRVSVRSYTVDANGALVDFAETTKVVETSDAYIKVFEEGGTVSGLPDVSYRFVMEIVRRMTFADTGQMVTLSPADKQILAEKFGKSVRQVERMLQAMLASGILRKKRRGCYQVNPYMFGRGRQGDIDYLRSRYMLESLRGDPPPGNRGTAKQQEGE